MLAGLEEAFPECTVNAIRTLMWKAIDYAGVFPPAALPVADAVRNYARYMGSADAWALGTFVLPLDRLEEFDAAAAGLGLERRIDLSAILPGPDFDPEPLRRALAFGSVVNAQVPVREPANVTAVAALTAPGIDIYFEAPATGTQLDLLTVIANEGERAKLRTGGTRHGSIPAPVDVVKFLRECRQARVGFKMTAGLHHAVRGIHPLTNEKDPPLELMHGFLNILLAAALVFTGGTDDDALRTIEEESAAAFRFTEDAAEWHNHRIAREELRFVREEFATSFGSCSFEEPLADLRSFGFLQAAAA